MNPKIKFFIASSALLFSIQSHAGVTQKEYQQALNNGKVIKLSAPSEAFKQFKASYPSSVVKTDKRVAIIEGDYDFSCKLKSLSEVDSGATKKNALLVLETIKQDIVQFDDMESGISLVFESESPENNQILESCHNKRTKRFHILFEMDSSSLGFAVLKEILP